MTALRSVVGDDLADRDENEDREDDHRDAAVVEQRHLAEEDEAEAAGADEAHDGRAADVDVPLEDDGAEDDRQDLRHDAVAA